MLFQMSTAYENQLEEFDTLKTKALAYDEEKGRIEKLEYELGLLKKLEGKLKEQNKNLKRELKSSAEIASQVENLVANAIDGKKQVRIYNPGSFKSRRFVCGIFSTKLGKS